MRRERLFELIMKLFLCSSTYGSKATIAFLQYAARQEENGAGELLNTSFRAVGFS